GALDGDALELGEVDVGLDLDLEGVGERAGLGKLDGVGVVEGGFADDLEVVLLDGLLIALGDERAADLLLDVAGESLLDELLRCVAGAEAWDGRLLAELGELLSQLGLDAILGDLNRHALGGWAGVLDLD